MVFNPWRITRKMFLSEEETAALIETLDRQAAEADSANLTPRVDQLIVYGLIFSGLRNSEFCQLRLADTVVGSGDSVFKVCGTPREDRTVYVPHILSNLVRNYVQDVRPALVAEGSAPRDLSGPLILNERGRPYERTGLYRRVVRILGGAGLAARASVQLLRHTYGYLAYKRSGGNLLFVQRQMGHSHPLVSSIYAEFVDEHYDLLADIVAGTVAQESSGPTDRSNRSRGKKQVATDRTKRREKKK